MKIPSFITPEMQAVIEKEYAACTDTQALAARLGLQPQQVRTAARAMRIFKDKDTKAKITADRNRLRPRYD